jgi:hypothetical protein
VGKRLTCASIAPPRASLPSAPAPLSPLRRLYRRWRGIRRLGFPPSVWRKTYLVWLSRAATISYHKQARFSSTNPDVTAQKRPMTCRELEVGLAGISRAPGAAEPRPAGGSEMRTTGGPCAAGSCGMAAATGKNGDRCDVERRPASGRGLWHRASERKQTTRPSNLALIGVTNGPSRYFSGKYTPRPVTQGRPRDPARRPAKNLLLPSHRAESVSESLSSCLSLSERAACDRCRS